MSQLQSVQGADSVQPFDRRDAGLVMAHLAVSFAALLLGAVAGLLQGLVRGGMIELPAGIGYYQLLTAHGVLMALVFTTFFIIGFLFSGVSKTLGGRLLPGVRRLGWISFLMMSAGTAIATVVILLNQATVLYTFYAPMKASPYFYIALALVVVGSWLSGIGIFLQYRWWKAANRGKLSPLLAFMSVVTMLLWLIATLGVAATVLVQFIPWSFGWVERIDVMVSRTLFWYFGHPLLLAAAGVYVLVRRHSEGDRGQNIQRRACPAFFYPAASVFDSGRIPSPADGAGHIARLEIHSGRADVYGRHSVADDRVFLVCDV